VKIQNQLSSTLVISDQLKDSVSQFQSGIKYVTLAPNGASGDTVSIADTIAGESAALKALLADESVKIIGVDNKLGSDFVPGLNTFVKTTPSLKWSHGGPVLFAGVVTLDGGGVFVVNFSGGVDAAGVLADGNLDIELAAATDYVVVATKQGSAPTIVPWVTKGITSFTITGDAAALVSVLAYRAV